MKVRIFTPFKLVTYIALLLALLPGGMVSISAQRPELGQSGIKAQATSKPIQEFTTTHALEPIDVEIVALSLTDSGLGVGETITLTAHTSPPLSQTHGMLNWTILSGDGTVDCGAPICTTEVASLTLKHPGPISHDTSGVVVGVEYVAGSHTVSDTLSIPLNEPVYHWPYIRNFTLHFGGKPFPEPGDTVTITLEHALPPGYVLISEHVEPASIVTDTETFVSVQLVAQAEYQDPWRQSFFDVFVEVFELPFSYDRDHNGTPDLVDDHFNAAWASLQVMPLVPPSNDVWRAPKALVAQMIRIPFWPFPSFTFDPNCEPSVFGYYQWNGSRVNDLQLCPKAFITPLQFWVTLCHEMKHWWDEKIVGKHQNHKDVERFGWWCGQLFWPFWTDIDKEIFRRMDPPVDPPPTFNVLWGSHVTWTLTLSNTNATYPLENLQFRLKSVMSSGGQYATGDTLGGGISVGANGLADTTAAGDDVQLIPVGQGRPHAIVIHPGTNGQLDTTPGGDDTVFPSEDRLTSGANGIVETSAQSDDVQVIPVGMGYTSTTFMPLAIGAGPNGLLDSAPQPDDQVVPPPSLPIMNLQVTTPISIPAGGQGTVRVAFDVADSIPGASGSGVVQMVFELTAQQGGGLRRETFEIFLFLPPKVYLPLVFKNY
jgi:hypothetical protein